MVVGAVVVGGAVVSGALVVTSDWLVVSALLSGAGLVSFLREANAKIETLRMTTTRMAAPTYRRVVMVFSFILNFLPFLFGLLLL